MRFLAFVAPALFLTSCMDDSKPVRVTVESDDFIPGIIHDITYECNGEIIDEPEPVFDSAAGKYTLKWDSCSAGEYTVTIESVFGEQTVQTFTVEEDSTLYVENNLPYTPTGFIPKETMLQADTVQFVRVISGCYQQDYHSVTLVRNQDGYAFSEYPVQAFGYENPRQVSAEEGAQLIEEFVASENEIEALRVEKAGELISSTSRQFVFFRADAQIYSYYDDGIEWVSYPQTYIP